MKYLDIVPPMIMGKELINRLSYYPTRQDISKMSNTERMIRCQDLYDVFVPNDMSVEIYNTIYLLLIQGCKRKEEGKLFHPTNEGSALICGVAGIGKSQSIARVRDILFPNEIVSLDNPYVMVIPILIIEVSTIGSFKSFLLSILYSIDRSIGSNYGFQNSKTNITTDQLLLAVSKALNNHVILLCIEELNFLNENSRSLSFANSIVALINIVNVSVLFVGVPKSLTFMSSSDYLARRSLGKVYRELSYEDFELLFNKLLECSYTLKQPIVDSSVIRHMYRSLKGNPALLKQIIHEACIYSIVSGHERIDSYSIKRAMENKLTTMEPFLNNGLLVNHQKRIDQTTSLNLVLDSNGQSVKLFEKIAKNHVKDPANMINHIKEYLTVEEISI